MDEKLIRVLRSLHKDAVYACSLNRIKGLENSNDTGKQDALAYAITLIEAEQKTNIDCGEYEPCAHCTIQGCAGCEYHKLKKDKPVPAVHCDNDQCQCNEKGYCECDEIEIVGGKCCFFNPEE